DGDVVGHHQRFGAHDHDVIHDHAHQVVTDGVVGVHGLGDGHLGAHAVGGGRQQRALVALQGGGVVQAGETADATDDVRPVRGPHGILHQFHCRVTGTRVDAGRGVGDRFAHGSLAPVNSW